MTRIPTLILAFVTTILYFSGKSFSQAPVLTNAADFTIFTGSGALNNAGTTTVEGNIGTHSGSVGGTPLIISGSSHINDQLSIDAETDLTNIFSTFISSGGVCNTLETPFGNSTTLLPGTYCLGSAGVITGDLTLDGAGNAGAVFVFNIGGELTGTNANIILTGLASWDNVYFIVDGAFNLNQTTTPITSVFRGNVIAKNAISVSSGAIMQGRLLSFAGAINLQDNIISTSPTPLPVTLTSFTVKKAEMQTTVLNWTTTAETNSDRFEIQRSTNGKIWNQLATISAKGESIALSLYQFTDSKPENGTNLYRLKMFDKDETFTYSRIRSAEITIPARTVLFPNPAIDYLTLHVDDISQIQRIQINDILGVNVYDKTKISSDLSSNLDVKALPAGMYIVRITNSSGNMASTKIIKQ